MVGIVSGIRAGLELGSREVLGQAGLIGNPAEGQNGQGVYVNVATGQLVVQTRDELLVGRGEDAAVLRTYNSAGQFNDDNGDNWASGVVSLRLAGTLNAVGSTISRVDRDGGTAVYSFDAARALYVSAEGAGAYDTISYVAASAQFEWRDGATGLVQRYEGAGALRLLLSRDTSGNTLMYGYGANGFFSSVTTSAGEATFYDYAGNKLSQIRTVVGTLTTTRVRYAYDASNRLAMVTVDLSPADNAVADQNVYQTAYTYDGLSNRVATITQSDGTSLSFTYVDAGAGNFKLATLRDGLGQTTTFAYLGAFSTLVTDAQGLVTRYSFDGAGRLTTIVAPASAGAAPPVQQYAYNASGDVIAAVDGQGRGVSFGYDANGNQVLQRDAAGNTVARTFDARNQLLTETAYLVPDPDGAGPALPGAPLTTRYVYDAGGRNQLRFVLSAEGRVTEHRYNAFGDRIATITYTAARFATAALAPTSAPSEADLLAWAALQNPAATQRVDMSYDARGQLTARTTYASVSPTGAGVLDGTQSVQAYVYDQSGLLLKTVSAKAGVTTYGYDGLGRLLTTSNALGETTLTQYPNGAGKTVLTLANGLVRTSSYDRAGRLLSVTESNAAGLALGVTRYFYDSSNLLRMTQDATGVRNWILYDPAGRKEAEVDGNGTMTEYAYLNVTFNHFDALQKWATEAGAQAILDMKDFTLEVKHRGRYYRLYPMFQASIGGRPAHLPHLTPDVRGFGGWRPYQALMHPHSSDKPLFKSFARESGLRTPEAMQFAAASPPMDYVLKARAGSFGRGLFGPYRADTPPSVGPQELAEHGELFAERFVQGRMLKVWFWGARAFFAHMQDYPSVTGDGRSSVERLVQSKVEGMLAAWEGFERKPVIQDCLAFQGLRFDDVPEEGREAWIDYRYGQVYPEAFGASARSDSRLEELLQLTGGQLAEMGRALANLLRQTIPVPVVITVDGVLDDQQQIWWLEMNTNSLLPPEAYAAMFADLFA